jgi:sugar/nucleoside kinase (ribokinase family)
VARNLTAVVAGHICLDIIPQIGGAADDFRKNFQPGRLAVVGPALFSTGGAASNTGLAMAHLGIDVRIMGKVGDDFIGEMIRSILARRGRGPAAGMIIDPRVNSSYTIVVSPPDTDRSFLHYPGANDAFDSNDIRYNVVDSASLFHFGYPPLMARMYAEDGAELAEMYRKAKATGVTTSLDMALPGAESPAGRANWPLILRRTLPHVDVFLPSFEEIVLMLRPEEYRRLDAQTQGNLLAAVDRELLRSLSDELLDLGAKVVGVKLGHLGFYLRTGSETQLADMGRARPADLAVWAGCETVAPCFKVNVVGTVGSGDCTIAGFLSALLRDLPPTEAARMAVAVGACNVEAADALSGVRTWDETLARVAAGWPQYEPQVR